ncbi:hypothetical protein [Nocardioides insulae]|uniref:hypothetical protein n=1 Tax=Nocardioides insulae TaxID=394734 RepID=UPI0004283B58|nr:hypothetical protein [Nocardioides insulae]
MNTTTTSSRIALTAATLSVAFWAAKSVAIGTAGGLGISPWENPLYFAGLLCHVTAVVSLGLALSTGRHPAQRALLVVALIGGALAITVLVGTIAASLEPAAPSWMWTELNLWVIGLLTLAAAWLVVRRQSLRASADHSLIPAS